MSEYPSHWDFKCIGEFASRIRRKNAGRDCQDPMTISAVDGLVSQRDYFNKIVASKNTEGYTLLHRNDFAYNKSYSDGYPVGAVRRLKTKDRGIVSPLYICFALDEEQIYLPFADFLFYSDWFVQAIYGIAKEGARSHGLLNIGIEEFFSASLPIPPLPEQKKIAEILSAIDTELNALEAEIEKIRNYALAISRRIFSELMLDESIQKRPADDLCSLVTKGTTPTKSATPGKKSVPFLRVTNLGFDGTIDPSQDFELITEASHRGELKRSICCPGDILMNIVGPPLGKVGIIPQEIGECNINQAVLVYRLSAEQLDPPFFVHYLLGQVAKSWLHSQSKKTSGQQNLTIEICKSLAVPLPSMSTQKKLSGCLDSLSAAVSHFVRKRSSLEFLKSAVASDILSGRKRVSV